MRLLYVSIFSYVIDYDANQSSVITYYRKFVSVDLNNYYIYKKKLRMN